MSDEATGQDSLEDLASQLISVTEAAEISGFTTGYVRRLLSEGKVEGVKIGRNWVTTEEAIREYMKQERRPGPKPEQE